MKRYIPDMNLIMSSIYAKRIIPYPFIAIFEFEDKKLIYVGTAHNNIYHPIPESFYAINYSFNNFDINCVVTELEHTYKFIPDSINRTDIKSGMNELVYSAYIAQRQNIPYICADTTLADWVSDLNKTLPNHAKILQTMWILNEAMKYKKHYKNNDTIENAFNKVRLRLESLGCNTIITIQEFTECVKTYFNCIVSDENISDILNGLKNWKEPNINGNITNKIWAEIDLYSRNPYMIRQIFYAINKYTTVLVTMGAGHYAEQRLILEKSFGIPKLIHNIPVTQYSGYLKWE